MNERIDVLAVIDRLIGNTRTMTGLTGDPRMREHLREGEEARAAVAELIEAVDALSKFSAITDWADLSEATSDETTRLWGRVDAALARVGAP